MPEYANLDVRPGLFSLDGVEGQFSGYTTGDRWNGFAVPLLTKESADALMAAWNAITYAPGFVARYDEAADTYFFESGEPEDVEFAQGTDHPCLGQTLHLYAIGAYLWCWFGDIVDA